MDNFSKFIFRHEKISVFLIYALLLSIAYAQVVFFGKTLQPIQYYPNQVYSDDSWIEDDADYVPIVTKPIFDSGEFYNTPAYERLLGDRISFNDLNKFVIAKGRNTINTFNIDLATPAFQEISSNKIVGNIYLKGQVPLWNPYQSCGVPFAAQYSTCVFFPYQVIKNMLNYSTWDYLLLFRLLLIGFFTFLFLRKISLSFIPAFLGGILYMLSGSMIWFINLEQFMNVAMMLPILFFCTEKLIQNPRGINVFLLSVSFGLMFLAGQPEPIPYIMLVLTGYCFFRVIIENRSKKIVFEKFFKFILSFAIGLGFAAPLLVLFFEYMPNSFNYHPPGGAMGVQSPADLCHIGQILMPTFHDMPVYYRYLPRNGIWDYLGGYSGVLVIYLVCRGVFNRKNKLRGYTLFFALLGSVIVLKNFNFFPFRLIGYLPIFDQVWSPRWTGFIWTFCFAAAAAMGLDAILFPAKHNVSLKPKRLKVTPVIAKTLQISALTIAFVFLGETILSYQRYLYYLDRYYSQVFIELLVWGMIKAVFVALIVFVLASYLCARRKNKGVAYAFVLLGVIELLFAIPKGTDFIWSSLRFIPLILGFLAVVFIVKNQIKLAIIGTAVFIISYTAIDTVSPYGFPDRKDIFKVPAYISFLKANQGYQRIMGNGVLMPNFAGAFGLYDIRFINSLSVDSYNCFINDLIFKNDIDNHRGVKLWFTGIINLDSDNNLRYKHRLYSLLGVKYILYPANYPVAKDALRNLKLVYEDGVKIYEAKDYLKRVFIPRSIIYAKKYWQAQDLVAGKGFNHKKTAVLEENLPVDEKRFITKGSQVAIKKYSPNQVVIEANMKNPGLVVLSDVFYPGWKVYVNEKESKIYRVNGLFRGVFLDKGNYIVVYKYFPDIFIKGIIICLLSLFACVYILLKERCLHRI